MSTYRPRRFVGVPCPGCIGRAPWIKTGSSLEPLCAPDVDAFSVVTTYDGAAVAFNSKEGKRATVKRVVTVDNIRAIVVTETYGRDPAHVNMCPKGQQCSGCADLEEGAY